MRQEVETARADVTLAQGRFERTELEKMELVRVLERKQTEMDSLNDQLEGLIKRQAQARQDLHSKDEKLEEVRRQLASAQVDIVSAQQQCESANKQVEWTRSELERTDSDFKEYRKQKVNITVRYST